MPFLILVCYFLLKYYMRTYRDLSRLESVTHSPIINHLTETLSGSTTIRNFNKSAEFVEANYKILDVNLNVSFWKSTVNKWFAVRLELAAKVTIFFAAGILVS